MEITVRLDKEGNDAFKFIVDKKKDAIYLLERVFEAYDIE